MRKQFLHHVAKLRTWHIFLIVIGCVGILWLVLNLFIVNKYPNRKELTIPESLSVNDDSLITTLASLVHSPITTGGDIEILNNGDAFYPAVFKDIEEAETSIYFCVYIWEEGVVFDQLIELLAEKARSGVAVKVILDSFGSKNIPKEKIEMLEEAGGVVSEFHPLSLGLLSDYHERNHARAIVIDGTIAYTGGMAVADYWQGSATDPDHWRDVMFRLSGPLVQGSEDTFISLWQITHSELLKPQYSRADTASTLQALSLTNLTPDEDIEQLSTFFSSSIMSAEESVYIATPYIVLEDDVQKALVEAAKRGVGVHILLPGKYMDSKIVRLSNHSHYRRLLEAGVHIYEYSPTMMHSKFMVIDGQWSIIGSANIDTRSIFYNIENILAVRDIAFAKELETIFQQDLLDSTEISLDVWQKRNIFRRLGELAASAFNKQF